MNFIPWNSSVISHHEVSKRLVETFQSEMFGRIWKRYTTNSMFSKTDILDPGRPYVVCYFIKRNDIFHIFAANMLVFSRYVRVCSETQRTRENLRKIYINKTISLLSNVEEDEYEYSDDDEYDERVSETKQSYREQLTELRNDIMCLYHLEFKDPSTGECFVIDPYAHLLNQEGEFRVCNVLSHDWNRTFHYSVDYADRSKALRRMDALRARIASDTWKEVCAMRIQRAWKKCMIDPAYTLCRKRLYEEYEELQCKKVKL